MPIRFRLADILRARGITAYRVAKDTGLALTTVYGMTSTRKRSGGIAWDTLEALCDYLDVEPGELLTRGGKGSAKA